MSIPKIISLLAFLLIRASVLFGADMPHEKIDPDCELCHSQVSFTEIDYDHSQADFSFDGAHSSLKCSRCHSLKDFSEADGSCLSCHTDVHEAKLGSDCAACHSSVSWSIFDIQTIHLQTSFPVVGRHALVDCQSCHTGMPRGDLSFNTTRCVGCHQPDYLETFNPNHVGAGLHTECDECHQMDTWRPALLPDHDMFFPIHSGRHRGEWIGCNDCHTSPNSFRDFQCTNCHSHARTPMDGAHSGISGYVYNSSDCYLCHPTGEKGTFASHDTQYFPIFTGVHGGEWRDCRTCHTVPSNRRIVDCLSCHAHNRATTDGTHGSMAGYAYNSADCYFCHPTGLRGVFAAHDAEFFPIHSGIHAGEWSDCTTCHPNPQARRQIDCLSCHAHAQAGTDSFHGSMAGYGYNSQDCYLCHPTGDRGQFVQHDGQYFPIFSGFHQGQWADCTTCHSTAGDRSRVDCLSCHTHSQTLMDGAHGNMPGYAYNSPDCYFCHPSGLRGQYTDHDAGSFPIFSGTHNGHWNDCTECHTVPADRKIFNCLGCHTNPTTDGIHGGMGGYSFSSPACYDCHPTGERGLFVDHDGQYFPIFSGIHNGRWNTCTNCHTVPTDRTIYSCLSCHTNPTTDGVHGGMAGYVYNSQECYGCHPTGQRGQFTQHDGQYFPIFSGKHNGKWNTCATCHIDPTNRIVFSCLSCHTNPTTDGVHGGMAGYVYNSQDCYLCHPTGERGQFTQHDGQYFPIFSGKHNGKWSNCTTCHIDPTDRRIFDCLSCHTNPTTDGIHGGMAGYSFSSLACYDCHPTGEGGSFVNHDGQYFPIFSGKHNGKWSTCATCHIDPTDRSVFSCFGCHAHDRSKMDDKHAGRPGYGYDSQLCLNCHPNGRG